MPEQIVKDEILTPFNVHLHKNGASRWQTAEDIINGRAVVLVVGPNSLFEVRSIGVEKKLVVDPRKNPPQRSCPEQENEAQ